MKLSESIGSKSEFEPATKQNKKKIQQKSKEKQPNEKKIEQK